MSVFEAAIGLLAPARCAGCDREGSSLCRQCAATLGDFGQRCWRCNGLSPGSKTCAGCRHTGSPSIVYISTDHDGLARDLLSLYKFGHQRAAATVLAAIMAGTLKNVSGDNYPDYIIVPVPTVTNHQRQRGFDHIELLAKQISHRLSLRALPALGRLGQARQIGARRQERLRQLSGKFYVRKPRLVLGRKILLIDDVVTTGGTIIAATQSLRAAGATRVDALLFAKRL